MRFLLCYCINRKQNNEYLQGRVKFPIGGKVRERFGAGFGATPEPTVTVWMEEDRDRNRMDVLRVFVSP